MNKHHPSNDIREEIYNANHDGLRKLADKIRELSLPTATVVGERGKEVMQQLERILTQLINDPNTERARAVLSGMARYTNEGKLHSYVEDESQLDNLTKRNLLKRGEALVDLGAGTGSLVSKWKRRGNPAVGIDASPTFVLQNPDLRLDLVDNGLDHLIRTIGGQILEQSHVAHSDLVLDRVDNQNQYLKNIADLARKYGWFIMSTLVPVIPRDDEDVAYPITYAHEANRVATAGTQVGELRQIAEFLEDYSKTLVKVENVPYQVKTDSGEQYYENHFMFTNRK